MPQKLTSFQIEQFKSLLCHRLFFIQSELRDQLHLFNGEIAKRTVQTIQHSVADPLNQLLEGRNSNNPVDSQAYLSELKEIETALRRINGGIFGICCDCGLSIQFKRLLRYPTARRCAVCQRLYEKIQNEDKR